MTVAQPWSFQRTFLRRTYNKEVFEHFKDLPQTDDPDISTGRPASKAACLIGPADSQNMALIKMMTFRYSIQRVHERPHVYGIPTANYHEDVTFKPQIKLYFSQDYAAVPVGVAPIRAEISFRLMNETSETVSQANAQLLATRIKAVFGLAGGYRWNKGKIRATYSDSSRGYQLGIYAYSETEGRQVVQKVLDIQNHTIETDLLTFSRPEKNSVSNPVGTRMILGKPRRKPRWKPIASVRFRWASLQLHGLNEDVALVDSTGHFPRALEKF